MNDITIGKARLINMDCTEFMRDIPDNYYELAICDPPYGIDAGRDIRAGIKTLKAAARRNDYSKKDWDSGCPPIEYFIELMRVSKHQIIWGVNYYPYEIFAGGRIFWDKLTAENYSNSDGEIAFCSKINSVKKFKYQWHGMLQGDMKNKEFRIHPTQKPIKLYEWLLTNYAKDGDKILDTHGGSFSSAIACNNLGFDFTGIELDADYYNAAVKRVEAASKQIRMFA